MRLLQYKDYFKARNASGKFFWRTKRLVAKIHLSWIRRSFFARARLYATSSNGRAFGGLMRIALNSFLATFIIAALIYFLENKIHVIQDFSLLNVKIFDQDWLFSILSYNIEKDLYLQFLGTVAGIIGVLLGLYFAGLSAVISSVYTKVPQDVRQLVVRDKMGNVYVKVISLLIALSIVLICITLLGAQPSHIGVIVVTALTCFAVFAFGYLGMGLFFLSDPSVLFGSINSEFNRWLQSAKKDGWGWQNETLQVQYRSQAIKALNTLFAVLKVSESKNELQSESLPRFIRNSIGLVINYIPDKRFIPTNSRWFGRKYEHKQWYLSDGTDIETAARTDTTLTPKEVPHSNWIEDDIINRVTEDLVNDAKRGAFENLHEKSSLLPPLFKQLGLFWLAIDAKYYSERFTKSILKNLINGVNTSTPNDNRLAYSVSFTDILCSLPLSIELGFFTAVDNLDTDKLKDIFAKTDWTKKGSPYGLNLPADTIKLLEQVAENASFEKKTKSPNKSPTWYIVEFTFNNIDWNLYRQWNELLTMIEEWYFTTADEFAASNLVHNEAAVYTRALEHAWKLDSHLKKLEDVVGRLRKDAKLDYLRPEWNFDRDSKRILKFRNAVIDKMAKSIPELMNEPSDPELPDYFGHAVQKTGEACFDSLINKDTLRFKKLIKLYFAGILATTDRIRPQVKEWRPETAMTWLTEPLMDLLDISGYAFIFAEFNQDPTIWNECKERWNDYLSISANEKLKLLSASLYLHKSLMGTITPRDPLRSGRVLAFNRLYNKLPRTPSANPWEEQGYDHPSEFIRNIAPHHRMPSFFDPIDIFAVLYLLERPEASGMNFGINDSEIESIKQHLEPRR